MIVSKITKHIATYVTLFSLMFSTFGITIYYHHCSREQITIKSVLSKVDCNHHQESDMVEETHNSCCHHSDEHSNECNDAQSTSKSEITLQTLQPPACCTDTQVTNQLKEKFLKNSTQNKSEKQVVVKEKREKIYDKKDIFTRTKEHIDKKIIQPIKKFISLLRQISKLSDQSDTDSSSY